MSTYRVYVTLPKALRLRVFPGPLPDTFDAELSAPITDAANIALFFMDVANSFAEAAQRYEEGFLG